MGVVAGVAVELYDGVSGPLAHSPAIQPLPSLPHQNLSSNHRSIRVLFLYDMWQEPK